MTVAQLVFSIALACIAVLVVFFALYVVSSTAWGDRWVRRRQ